MLKKIINKIIMGTKCYLALKDALIELEHKNMALHTDLETQTLELIDLKNTISYNKTQARKIVRLLNANFDKKNGTIKQIKALCNKIIKGE